MKDDACQYFIRVTHVEVFNALVAAAENLAARQTATFETRRYQGYYELATRNSALWRELYLYGQILAQAQHAHIDGGEWRK